MNADLWLNGQPLGNHPYGYTSFWYDVSDKLKFGETNVIAVRVKNEGLNSRWYSGSGIYRHVWLQILEPVHLAQWGTYITSSEVNAGTARVNVRSTVENKSNSPQTVRLSTNLFDPDGRDIIRIENAQSIGPSGRFEYNQNFIVTQPKLWSIESPQLYSAITEVFVGEKLTDRYITKFGIRSIAFDVLNGFQLNAKSLKLKGGCVHHDNGPLGSKAYDRAEERRIELLKESGFNAIRCAHNPPSPAFLDACDRLGMLVIDEAFDMWRLANNPDDYHLYFDSCWQKDIESMVMRDRNHPSIIMWSIGNEIRGMETPPVINVAKMLGNHIRKIEPTRPITAAVNGLSPKKDSFFAALDVGGYNYAAGGDHSKKSIYALDHKRVPDRVMWGSESYALVSHDAWKGVVDHSWVIGDFVWTAFDYIGEASIGWRGYMQESNFFPWNLAYCGDIDICGWKRPQSYYRDVLWKENQVSIFVKSPKPSFPLNPKKKYWSKWEWHDVVADWNWSAKTPSETGFEKKRFEVEVYSSCEEIELFLNDKSLGKKKTSSENKFKATWKVPYTPGTIKAVGYRNNTLVATSQLTTAQNPSKIRLSADRAAIKADGQDLSYITVELVDEKGIRHPKAEDLLKFSIKGPGIIVGVGNANPMSLESYQLQERKAWQGRCLVIVKSTKKEGKITLSASADGITSSQLTITAE
jgi:beta-galactosidase